MQILVAISILCFLAVAWAGVAGARHIRNSRQRDSASSSTQRDFAHHLFSASAHGDSHEARFVPSQSIRDITAKKSWNKPPDLVTVRPNQEHRSPTNRYVAESLEGLRKLPQATHQGPERLDWAYFNKDSGDLTDPYESPRIRANSRNPLRRN